MQQLPEVKADGAGRVGHKYHGQLLSRICPEVRAGRTRPVKLSARARHPSTAGVASHRDTEAKAIAVDVRPSPEPAGVDFRVHVVGRHELDRFSSQDSFAIEHTAVQ